MTSRLDFSAPRAAQNKLTSFGQRLLAVERRSNWIGSPRVDVRGESPQPDLTFQSPSDPDYPEGSPVCELVLDPGRWIIMFVANLGAVVSPGWAQVGMIAYVTADGVTQEFISLASVADSGAGVGYAQEPRRVVEVIGESQIVAASSVFVAGGGEASYSNGYFWGASILAFPG